MMTLQDDYGIVSEARQRRAQYGNRTGHGWSRVPMLPEASPKALPERQDTKPAKKLGPIFGRAATPSPDLPLAEMIKAAGERRALGQNLGSRECRLNWQSTLLLIYERAHMSMASVAVLYALPEPEAARALIKAAQDRNNRRYGVAAVRSEQDRQRQIMALIPASQREHP